MSALKRWLDPFILMLLAALAAGLLLPVPDGVLAVIRTAAQVAITVLFFTYGLRLPTREVLAGLRHVRLQGVILVMTFVIFPMIGLLASWALRPVLGEALATAVLFTCLLPTTIQGAVALTSVARGNVSAAICATTISNVLGMLITPLLVLVLMGAVALPGFGGIRSVLLQLLLPFVIGQLLSRWAGEWIRSAKRLTLVIDRGAITLMLFSAVAYATAQGVWSQVDWQHLVVLLVASAVILTAVSTMLWLLGPRLGLARADRIVLLFCGSHKSLATGLPIAAVLFPPAAVATMAVPLIMYHQLQLVAGAVLARRAAPPPEPARS